MNDFIMGIWTALTVDARWELVPAMQCIGCTDHWPWGGWNK